jgi:hypothetical protein
MPLIGPKVQTQVPETIKDFIGRLAAQHGVKEAVVVRELIMVGAAHAEQERLGALERV